MALAGWWVDPELPSWALNKPYYRSLLLMQHKMTLLTPHFDPKMILLSPCFYPVPWKWWNFDKIPPTCSMPPLNTSFSSFSLLLPLSGEEEVYAGAQNCKIPVKKAKFLIWFFGCPYTSFSSFSLLLRLWGEEEVYVGAQNSKVSVKKAQFLNGFFGCL